MALKSIAGRIAYIDLSGGAVRVKSVEEDLVKLYAGGVGYAARKLLEYAAKRGVPDPFSPDNPVFIMSGTLTGVSAFGVKGGMIFVSPLTGGLGKCTCSAAWAIQLKKAGFDGLVVVGASERPVMIVVDDGRVDVVPAEDLWGLDALEASARVRNKLGGGFRAMVIGTAGEKLVRISSVLTDDRRVCARTGPGAVWGSKKLKAIAVRGSREIPVHDAELLKKLNTEWLLKAPNTVRGRSLGEYGTAGGVTTFIQTGNLPIMHWRRGELPGAENLSGRTMMERYRKGPAGGPVSRGSAVLRARGR